MDSGDLDAFILVVFQYPGFLFYIYASKKLVMSPIVFCAALVLVILAHGAIQYYGWYRMHMEYYISPAKPFKLILATIVYVFASKFSSECIHGLLDNIKVTDAQLGFWLIAIACFGLPSLVLYFLARRNAKRDVKLYGAN